MHSTTSDWSLDTDSIAGKQLSGVKSTWQMTHEILNAFDIISRQDICPFPNIRLMISSETKDNNHIPQLFKSHSASE